MAYRLLIVDDSPAMRRYIRRVAELSGLEIDEMFEAGDGSEALKVLQSEWVDAVLTDINMPQMNGEEFVHRLAQDDMLRTLPVLVVSTDSTGERMERLLQLGVKGYLKKPFTPEDLREQIERVLYPQEVAQ